MNFRVQLEKDEDGMWVVTCPSLPGCVSQGKTEEQAAKNIQKAIQLHLQCLAEDGETFRRSRHRIKERLIALLD